MPDKAAGISCYQKLNLVFVVEWLGWILSGSLVLIQNYSELASLLRGFYSDNFIKFTLDFLINKTYIYPVTCRHIWKQIATTFSEFLSGLRGLISIPGESTMSLLGRAAGTRCNRGLSLSWSQTFDGETQTQTEIKQCMKNILFWKVQYFLPLVKHRKYSFWSFRHLTLSFDHQTQPIWSLFDCVWNELTVHFIKGIINVVPQVISSCFSPCAYNFTYLWCVWEQ